MTTFTDDDLDVLRADLDAAGVTRELVLAEVASRDEGAAQDTAIRPRRLWLAAAAVAAVTAGAIGAPAVLGSESGGAIALGPATPLEFPLSVQRPAGLGAPTYGLDGAQKYVYWDGPGSGDGLSVAVHESLDVEEVNEIPSSAAEVTVHAHEAYSFRSTSGWTVAWEQDGDAVSVTGRGELADADQVLAIAETITEEPVSVGLPLSVTPQGWEVTAYNEVAVTVTDDGDPSRHLTMVRTDALSKDLAASTGAFDIATQVVAGRTVTTGRVAFDDGTGWIAETVDGDGDPVSLQAPAEMTRTQVERIAVGVD